MTNAAHSEVLPTPENSSGGVAIVTFGGLGPEVKPARRGFFFDNSIDRGTVLNRFCTWFDAWGIPVQRLRGSDGAFERSFFTFEWPADPITNAHGPQMVGKIAEQIDALKTMLEERRPRLVIFLSCYLWQAANTEASRAALLPVIGAPLEDGRRITTARLAAYLQPWQGTTMLALPQPSKNTTPAFVATLAAGVQEAFERAECLPESSVDPLLKSASAFLIVDRLESIRSLRAHLHVSEARAQALFDALEGRAWQRAADGRLRVIDAD